jgi:hypothetical protein
MRIFLLALSLFLFTQGANATTKEPFGAPLMAVVPKWRAALDERFKGKDRNLVVSIANQVRPKDKKDWLTWINQLVALEVGKRNSTDNCAPFAVAKFEVLRELGFDKDNLRLVVGHWDKSKPNVLHAVLSVLVNDEWMVLDNGTIYTGYQAKSEGNIPARFEPLFVLH